jgi:hypothetical protein
MNYKEAKKIAKKLHNTAYGDISYYAVTIVHEEGTILHYQNAYAVKLDEEWVAIDTEHHGYFVYSMDEVNVYMFKRLWDIFDLNQFKHVDLKDIYDEDIGGSTRG